ncbi:hypothetical protein BDN67DRAFT_656233 [Paxillus ammoniavirescens]|nr:hypothetical protein BDN67DRAFT_656233 [Paxillus ammoniavirescens]
MPWVLPAALFCMGGDRVTFATMQSDYKQFYELSKEGSPYRACHYPSGKRNRYGNGEVGMSGCYKRMILFPLDTHLSRRQKVTDHMSRELSNFNVQGKYSVASEGGLELRVFEGIGFAVGKAFPNDDLLSST